MLKIFLRKKEVDSSTPLIRSKINKLTKTNFMKNLKSLKGARTLSNDEQKSLAGGAADICQLVLCIPEEVCVKGIGCVPREYLW